MPVPGIHAQRRPPRIRGIAFPVPAHPPMAALSSGCGAPGESMRPFYTSEEAAAQLLAVTMASREKSAAISGVMHQ